MLYLISKKVTLVGCVSVRYEECRPTEQLEMIIIIENIDGDVIGYIVEGVIGDVLLAIFVVTFVARIGGGDLKGERVGGTIVENIKITRSLVE